MTTPSLQPPESVVALPTPAVRVDGLTKHYDGRTVVNDLTFEMRPGTITGFVGPNGAGKTTTIRMLLGLVRSDAGERDVCGGDRSKVGALIDGPAFYPALSARKNLRLLATLGNISPSRVAEVLDQTDLTERSDDAVRTYSVGMCQRLGIAAALLPNPEVLFLDEPTNGLDPQGIRDMRALLRQLAEAGKSILVSSHLLSEIEHICDHLVVIRDGTKMFFGPTNDLERRQRAELTVSPDNPEDLGRLIALLRDHDYEASRKNNSVRVAAATDCAAAINRLAFQSGITLVEIHGETEDLESTFLRMMSARES